MLRVCHKIRKTMSSFQTWANDPEGGASGWRIKIKYELLGHDPECRSLSEAWLPREGGVSCPSDLFDCSDCGVMFFNEGCYGGVEDDEGWYMYCDCCARRLGKEYK